MRCFTTDCRSGTNLVARILDRQTNDEACTRLATITAGDSITDASPLSRSTGMLCSDVSGVGYTQCTRSNWPLGRGVANIEWGNSAELHQNPELSSGSCCR
jgi:hypothetical protein